jgi:hypothetical protein
MMIDELQDLKIIEFDAYNGELFYVGKKLILVEEGIPHFIVGICCMMEYVCWDLIEQENIRI